MFSQMSLGTKHKTMLEARNGSGTIKAFPRAGVKGKGPINKGNTGLQNKTFHCEICDVHVNSETQLKQVLNSGVIFWLLILYFHNFPLKNYQHGQANMSSPCSEYAWPQTS